MLKKTDRSKDAHEKIQLGGLVVKAGLREENKSFLLGVLLHAAMKVDDPSFYASMKLIGDQAFKDG